MIRFYNTWGIVLRGGHNFKALHKIWCFVAPSPLLVPLKSVCLALVASTCNHLVVSVSTRIACLHRVPRLAPSAIKISKCRSVSHKLCQEIMMGGFGCGMGKQGPGWQSPYSGGGGLLHTLHNSFVPCYPWLGGFW
jgi:hypothetical protein